MFGRMAELVSAQGETVQRIDDNVDLSLDYTKKGQGELLKYYNRLKGQRAFIVKLFAVLLLFIGFFMWMF